MLLRATTWEKQEDQRHNDPLLPLPVSDACWRPTAVEPRVRKEPLEPERRVKARDKEICWAKKYKGFSCFSSDPDPEGTPWLLWHFSRAKTTETRMKFAQETDPCQGGWPEWNTFNFVKLWDSTRCEWGHYIHVVSCCSKLLMTPTGFYLVVI